MPSTKKAPGRSSTAEAVRARGEEEIERMQRLAATLDAAQDDLTKIRGSIGAGVSDLRRDLARALRDARRDVKKMTTATRRDLQRLQKDLRAASSSTPRRGG